MKIQASAEDYLETIYVLSKEKENVRAIDIANYTGYAKPTISIILKQFRENDYIVLDNQKNIFLTERGKKIATRIYERHNLIANFLMAIGVEKEIAFADACKLEHGFSEKSFECLSDYFNKNLKGC